MCCMPFNKLVFLQKTFTQKFQLIFVLQSVPVFSPLHKYYRQLSFLEILFSNNEMHIINKILNNGQ